MGWFESQIEERQRSDEQLLEESLRAISDAVAGKARAGGPDAAAQAQAALEAVLAYYGAKLPDGVELDGDEDIAEVIEGRLAPTGLMARPVRLPRGWHKDAVGAFIGFTEEGVPVALLPRVRSGYSVLSPETGALEPVATTGIRLKEEAFCFYRPLPARAITVRDLVAYSLRSLDRSDYAFVVLATLAATLLGMLVPTVNQVIFGPVIESGDTRLLFPAVSLLLGASVAQLLLSAVRGLVMSRIQTKLTLPLEAAVMMRLLSLPTSFFRTQQTGDLASKLGVITSVASILQNALLSTSLSSVFSLAYIAQIASFAPALVLPALAIIAATTVFSIVLVFVRQARSRETYVLSGRLSGWQYSIINGIQKIKLSGAETRAFAKWANGYAEIANLECNGPRLLRYSSAVGTAISLAGTLVFYSASLAGGVTVSEYMAFASAFGMVSAAFSSLTSMAGQLAVVKPNLEGVKPMMDAVPESSEGKRCVRRLSGAFELDHVTFSYDDSERLVLDDLCLSVKAGSYVAVVGKTGCGKSTLMRILLGFEQPKRGAVSYDRCDLRSLDLRSVRRNIGVVLQDGKLFAGSIYDNIAVSCPGLTQQEAWEAAEMAGLAEDIRAMPMGMQTMVTEGGGGVSGGQRQRLMIARAVAGKPRILMFDEATSALDNVTQRIVGESLDALKCTRLVIAHRLSTIRHCDRIVLLDHGRIAEDGTYEELMEKGGLFAELVSRQQV
ncbi:MAG: ATP-binding cassette domain-containing protein [Coriobacteriia bacterium]|nr:ATP-binding cassette domain-containing protein [Coriobacteriia bacterium]